MLLSYVNISLTAIAHLPHPPRPHTPIYIYIYIIYIYISHRHTDIIYIHLTFTVKGFKVIYSCTKVSNVERTVNKDCSNYMKQMFNTCENAYKTYYHIIFLEICKS